MLALRVFLVITLVLRLIPPIEKKNVWQTFNPFEKLFELIAFFMLNTHQKHDQFNEDWKCLQINHEIWNLRKINQFPSADPSHLQLVMKKVKPSERRTRNVSAKLDDRRKESLWTKSRALSSWWKWRTLTTTMKMWVEVNEIWKIESSLKK